MPIEILVGDDTFCVSQHIASYKAQLDPQWLAMAYHRFDVRDLKADQLQTVLRRDIAPIARTVPVAGQSLIVLYLSLDSNIDPVALSWLEHLPATTTLLLVPSPFDQRLKLCKWLKSLGTLHRFELPNEWKSDEIETALLLQAKELGVKLSESVCRYLVKAIGGDTARMHSELRKIALYAQGKQEALPLAELQRLVPDHHQNVWQLGEAIAQGDTAQVITLTQSLLSTQHPNALLYPLISRFRTWLWVKAALSNSHSDIRAKRKPQCSDLELAKLCGLNNPNRLYYLKRDVARWRLPQLVAAVQHLVTLQQPGYQGELLSGLVAIAQLFT